MKKRELKTKHLQVTPMTDEELQEEAAGQTEERLKQLYTEIGSSCRARPEQRLWYTVWRITLRESGEQAGTVGFLGAPQNSAVELRCRINSDFRGQGYAEEAIRAAADWAFSQPDMYFVTASIEKDNAAAAAALETVGFARSGQKKDMLYYELEKPRTCWGSICFLFGLAIGYACGMSSTDMCIGMVLGMVIGMPFDRQDREKRKTLREARMG
ncbi:MAG: GNAT family N-acetyltransferase, partial [Oscillospiraceae bacterium]|nr:GNAT family N-acetyltransferase [Oscillospiraceae bacterium]